MIRCWVLLNLHTSNRDCAEMVHLGHGEHPHCSWISHNLPWIQTFNFIHVAQILVFSHLNNCNIFFTTIFLSLIQNEFWKMNFPGLIVTLCLPPFDFQQLHCQLKYFVPVLKNLLFCNHHNLLKCWLLLP